MKQINLILAVDCSNSMKGSSIGAVNDAALNILQMFESIVTSTGVMASVSKIEIRDSASVSNLIPVGEYTWKDIPCGGLTSFADFFLELNKAMDGATDEAENLVVLLSDGASTDDHVPTFCTLLKSKRFQKARKVAIAVCPDYDDYLLEAFCGSSRYVYTVNDLEKVGDLFLSVCSAS